MQDAKKPILQSWVGEQVLLARTTAAESELVNLLEVNETGLVYAYKAGDLVDVPIFVAWTSVSWVRPSIPGDLAETSEGSEAAE